MKENKHEYEILLHRSLLSICIWVMREKRRQMACFFLFFYLLFDGNSWSKRLWYKIYWEISSSSSSLSTSSSSSSSSSFRPFSVNWGNWYAYQHKFLLFNEMLKIEIISFGRFDFNRIVNIKNLFLLIKVTLNAPKTIYHNPPKCMLWHAVVTMHVRTLMIHYNSYSKKCLYFLFFEWST